MLVDSLNEGKRSRDGGGQQRTRRRGGDEETRKNEIERAYYREGSLWRSSFGEQCLFYQTPSLSESVGGRGIHDNACLRGEWRVALVLISHRNFSRSDLLANGFTDRFCVSPFISRSDEYSTKWIGARDSASNATGACSPSSAHSTAEEGACIVELVCHDLRIEWFAMLYIKQGSKLEFEGRILECEAKGRFEREKERDGRSFVERRKRSN